MHISRLQQIEARKANDRINYYLTGGSRPVFVFRGVLAGLLIIIWVVLWWQS
jgi:hypothetical protein